MISQEPEVSVQLQPRSVESDLVKESDKRRQVDPLQSGQLPLSALLMFHSKLSKLADPLEVSVPVPSPTCSPVAVMDDSQNVQE